MTPVTGDILESLDGVPPTLAAGRHVAFEARANIQRLRVGWYAAATAAAILGGLATVIAYRLSGSYYPFVSGFAMMFVIGGGFGPSAVAGLGSLALAHVLSPSGAMLPELAAEIVRLGANVILLLFASTLAGLFRRSRLATLEREGRLERAVSSMRELLEESSDAIALTDVDLRITYVNSRAERVLGFAKGEAVGRSVNSIIAPESMASLPLNIGDLRDGQTIQLDRRALRADGSIMDIEVSARFLSGGRLLVTIRDLGESRREAERQRAERDLLNGILATSVAGVLTVDINGDITFANRRAESLLRLTKETADASRYQNPTWRQAALDGGDWPRGSQPFNRVVETNAAVFDVRFALVWPDGQRQALSVNGAPIHDANGQLRSVVFAVNDITSARAAAEALRDSDRQLVQITDAMPGIVYQYVMDADGRDRFVFVSQFGEKLLGRSAQQLLDDVGTAWSLVHRDDIEPTRDSLMRSFRTMSPWIHEFRIQDVHSSGSWRWVSGHAVPQPGPTEGSVLWNGIFIDITDRKTLEDDLRQVQRIESVGLLAGGIAHDFNNLLTVILGEAELISMDLPADARFAEGVQQIRHAAQSGATLTRQLLGFARKQVVAPHVISINELVRRVPALIGRLLGESITLDIVLMEEPPLVMVDPSQLDQVLVNLVMNARDAMPDGGRLEIRTKVTDADALRAEGTILPAGPVAEICVRDWGMGMSDDVRDRAFEPFYTTKEIGKGTGLGLATSYGIVSQADGTIVIDSERGRGTKVRVLLPIYAEDAAVPRTRPRSTTPTGHETILVVDDDAAVRHVTATALRRQGYRVFEADDGPAALAVSRSEPTRLHLLVTDVAMPKMSGPVLAEQLARERPEMKVLYVSGYAQEGIAARGVLLDGVAMLQKPYDIRELAQRVRALLELKPVALPDARVDQRLIDQRAESRSSVAAIGQLLHHENDDEAFHGINEIS